MLSSSTFHVNSGREDVKKSDTEGHDDNTNDGGDDLDDDNDEDTMEMQTNMSSRKMKQSQVNLKQRS